MTPHIELAGAAKLAHEMIQHHCCVHAAAAEVDLCWLLAEWGRGSDLLAEVELQAQEYHLAADWRTEQRRLLSAVTQDC